MIFNDDKSYYLQNVTAGYVGNSPLFWAKKDGYTPWLEHARWFTKEDAEKIIHSTRGTHQWAMWSVEELNSIAKTTVDIQDMRKLPSQEQTPTVI